MWEIKCIRTICFVGLGINFGLCRIMVSLLAEMDIKIVCGIFYSVNYPVFYFRKNDIFPKMEKDAGISIGDSGCLSYADLCVNSFYKTDCTRVSIPAGSVLVIPVGDRNIW